MYTNHVWVVWNGIQSRWFGVLNGVKHGGVLSPVLFCVYIANVAQSNVKCYTGLMFLGALAYADDVVLLAPTASAMHKMLHICEEYALNFSVKFKLSKSKCVVCELHSKLKPSNFNHSLSFTL